MTGESRAVAVGVPHHGTQRGNIRQDVFFVDDDRRRYLVMLQSKAGQYGLTIHACCLMTNHVYIVATPRHEASPGKMVRKAWRYPWSSAALHVAGQDPLGLLSFSEWPAYCRGERWRRQLQDPEDDQMIGRIRNTTFMGCPLGSDRIISRIEPPLGRRLRPAPMGRLRKKAKFKRKRHEK